MSSEEENIYDPINSIKFQSESFTTIKTICSIISISLIITFFAFSNQSHQSLIIVPAHKQTVENTIHRSLTQKPPSSEKTTISHILFGIAGSVKTWDGRSHYAKLWWKPNITRGYVWMDEKPSTNKTWPATLPAYKEKMRLDYIMHLMQQAILDIRGNPYGILAAHPLAPLVSLHHLDTIQTLFPGPALSQHDSLKKLISAYNMDPGRTVQHSLCYDLNRNWSLSVSWGYAVELYPSLLTAKKLETTLLTFQTWKTLSDEPFTFNTRPVSLDPCEKPVMFYLDRVDIVDGRNTTLTTYKRFVDDLESECARVDYAPALAIRLVNISAIQFDPRLWSKAPRRQCCEMINGTDDGDEKVVHLQIRSCNRFESVTPPR